MEYVTVKYPDGSTRVVNSIFAREHRTSLTIVPDVKTEDCKPEDSEISRLRKECDDLGIKWHHKAKAKTLLKKIAEAKEEE